MQYQHEVPQELGYEICVARDLQEALYYLNKLDCMDLLVTDVSLPGMNGRQLAEIVQQQHPQLNRPGFSRHSSINQYCER